MKEFSIYPTRRILDRLGGIDGRLEIIHISGTNGKGSTAAYFANILKAAGIRAGLFTSPQTYDFYDQFKIDGKIIAPDIMDLYINEAARAAQAEDSEFEIITAAALLAFCREGCTHAVIECGMGGLNDATNAVSRKRLAVITSISLEHTAYLGNSLQAICAHKAGIIKNCPAIVNAYQCEEVKAYFKPLGVIFADKVEKIYPGGFIYDGISYTLELKGSAQAYNAACAIEGARLLGISQAAISGGIAATRVEGRVEKIVAGGTTYILDGAHNPAAFEPLKEYLGGKKATRTIIFGCLSDKDIDGNLISLSSLADRIIAVQCPGPRATAPGKTLLTCAKYFKTAIPAQTLCAALDMAEGDEVVVCGSFTLLKEAKNWIDKKL